MKVSRELITSHNLLAFTHGPHVCWADFIRYTGLLTKDRDKRRMRYSPNNKITRTADKGYRIKQMRVSCCSMYVYQRPLHDVCPCGMKKGVITVVVKGKVLWLGNNLVVKGFHRVQVPARKLWAQSLAIGPPLASVCFGGRFRATTGGPKCLCEAEGLTARVVATVALPKKEKDKWWDQ